MGHKCTGPPWNVGRPTAHVPGGWPVSLHAALQTTTDDDRRHQAKQYWPIRRASNNVTYLRHNMEIVS